MIANKALVPTRKVDGAKMSKIAFSFLLLVSGCTTVKDPAPTTISAPPAGNSVASELSFVEKISAAPTLVCDPRAAARTEVRVRHLHIEAFAKGYHPTKEASSEELLDAYGKLEIARQELINGNSFESAFKRYSDPRKASPSPDGDLGFAKRGFLPKEFDRVVFCLAKGEISPVFRTGFGFHVAQVTDVRY